MKSTALNEKSNIKMQKSELRTCSIPIPITTIGMRLPPNRIVGKWVAASKPQALGMASDARGRLKTCSETMNFSILILLMYLSALFVILSPIPAQAVESWKEFAVQPTTDDQELPDIYGDIIVWQQFVDEFGDYDVYVADRKSVV